MRLNEEDIRFGQTVFHNTDAFRYFLLELKQKHPDFFMELGRTCDEFVEHCTLRENDIRGRRHLSQLFLSYACGKIGALYKANGDKIPPATTSRFRELKAGCDSIDKIQERIDLLRIVDHAWTEYFLLYAYNENFCEHGVGPVYALAEAFIEAQELEEKREIDAADVAQRTKTLKLDWISGLEINLPDGKKDIGEE